MADCVVGRFLEKLRDPDSIIADEGLFRTVSVDAAWNRLEAADYDNTHGTVSKAGTVLSERYLSFIETPNSTDMDLLEIGCGTGLLTAGLVQSPRVNLCVSVDISRAFLRTALARAQAANPDPRLILLCSDLNDLPFSDGVFDAVFGNSILHHIYDYQNLLENLRRLLRPGGRLVFSEPCQQGKSLISFFLSAIMKFDSTQEAPYFSDGERNRIQGILGVHMRELLSARDPSMKMKWEDKHIFDTDKLSAVARNSGFSGFERYNTDPVRDGLRASAERTLKIVGITKSLEPFRFIFDAFQEQYVRVLPDSIETPHQFLVFTR